VIETRLSESDSGRTALMIASRFPPCTVSPTAAARAHGLASWLPDFGWDPVVLAPEVGSTCQCEGCRSSKDWTADRYRVLRVPVKARSSLPPRVRAAGAARTVQAAMHTARAGRRLIVAAGTDLDSTSDWPHSVVQSAQALIERRRIDAVWATAWPLSSLWSASHIAPPNGLPWVADIRDSMALEWQLAFNRNRPLNERVRHFKNRPALLRARRILRGAAAVVEVSPQHAARDSQWLGRPCEFIPSGFDPSDWEVVPLSTEGRSQLEVICMGRMYPGYRTLRAAFAGLRLLLERHPDLPIRIVYYGNSEAVVESDAALCGVGAHVECHGFIQPDQLRRVTKSADVLLLPTTEYSGVPGGKLYEYLAARRPILAVPGRDKFVSQVLEETASGRVASTPDEVAALLHSWVDEWVRNGRVLFSGRSEAIERYSIREGARRLAELMSAAALTNLAGRQPVRSRQ
jgi:glycosyltransferase involved in cell wall biosynthesis